MCLAAKSVSPTKGSLFTKTKSLRVTRALGKFLNRLISTSCNPMFAFKFSFAISITFSLIVSLKKKGIAIIAMMRSNRVIPPHFSIFLAIFIRVLAIMFSECKDTK